MSYTLDDGEDIGNSGLRSLAIHIILKAIEDYYAEIVDEDSRIAYISANDFFNGGEFDSHYPMYLEWLGWDTDIYGTISPEKWCDMLERDYSSVAEARPKLGLSTRLIPKGSELWEKIREGRERGTASSP